MDTKDLLSYIRLLREKAHTDKLIFFVGAGVSCNVDGMPSWNDLICKMADSIKYSRCSTCKEKTKDCNKTCKLANTFSPDDFLKIPQYVYNKNKRLYQRILSENIEHDRGIDAPLSKAILDLAPAHIITTNYDKLLEDCNSEQKDNYQVIIHDKDLLTTAKKKYIIKMHGDITDLDTIVLKEADYLEYSQKHVLIELFVKSLLTDHTIVFLGYSLNDYNIKLIISWINYIRTQNKAIQHDDKFGYIIFDSAKITKTQHKYFENNNIGIINLNKMPILGDTPSELKNKIGQRLHSFLRVIESSSLEHVLGIKPTYSEAIDFMRKYKFIDCRNICALLSIRRYNVDGQELMLYSESEYDLLIEHLTRDDRNKVYLNQLFCDAGIAYIRLVSTNSQRHESYKVTAPNKSLQEDSFYKLYLNNDYVSLSVKTATSAKAFPFESSFYSSLVRDYSPSVFDFFNTIEFDKLEASQKVRYLFNQAVLDSRKTFKYSGKRLSKYINGIADTREQKLFSAYIDILDGNYQKLNNLEKSLSKLKEQYYSGHHSFLGCSSLSEFYKIQNIAVTTYLFYFTNTLMFAGFSDLKKILKYYVEAMICTNGKFTDVSTNSAFGFRSVKNRYMLNNIDFDILTKMISPKDLNRLIEEYSVEHFAVSDHFIDHILDCFRNTARSIMQLSLYHRFYTAPNILINCATILLHVPLNDKQKNIIANTLDDLFNDDDFLNFFFSTDYPDHSLCAKLFCKLTGLIPKQNNFDIVKKIICSKDFKDYYVNTNVYSLQQFFSVFLGGSVSQADLNNFITSFSNRDRVITLRLLYKHITEPQYISAQKQFLSETINTLSSDDVFDFTFSDWLEITPAYEDKIISDAINIYKQQKASAMRSYPDPLQSKLELIYILYLTDKISSLCRLEEIIDASDFLFFFIRPEEFDYSKVDLSNYMWENIAKHEQYMNLLIRHKEHIIPSIQKRIDLDQATEFERKVLYGYFLDKQTLL